MPPPAVRLDLRALQRLPGRASTLLRLVAGYRLWLAPDFLLQLKTLPYSQEAQRFAYRDIQALQICKTWRGKIYNVILSVLLLFFALVAANVNQPWELVIFAGFFFVLLIVNGARGPTCRCVLQTSLGEQTLPSLSRLRPARRALALLVERVEAAQA